MSRHGLTYFRPRYLEKKERRGTATEGSAISNNQKDESPRIGLQRKKTVTLVSREMLRDAKLLEGEHPLGEGMSMAESWKGQRKGESGRSFED